MTNSTTTTKRNYKHWTSNARTRFIRALIRGESYAQISTRTGITVSSLYSQAYLIRQGAIADYNPPKDVADYIEAQRQREKTTHLQREVHRHKGAIAAKWWRLSWLRSMFKAAA